VRKNWEQRSSQERLHLQHVSPRDSRSITARGFNTPKHFTSEWYPKTVDRRAWKFTQNIFFCMMRVPVPFHCGKQHHTVPITAAYDRPLLSPTKYSHMKFLENLAAAELFHADGHVRKFLRFASEDKA
jgi:hypothetical protein